MELSDSQMQMLAAAAVVGSLIAITMSAVALAGQRRVRRAYSMVAQGRRQDVLSLMERYIAEVTELRSDVRGLRAFAEQLRELDRRAISRTSMMRYDAFDDMGGHLSFSAALLDEHGDGLVVSAINGRTDTRVYAKPVERGESRHNLSQEESSVIARALSASREPDPRVRRARRNERGEQAPARKARPARSPRSVPAPPMERP